MTPHYRKNLVNDLGGIKRDLKIRSFSIGDLSRVLNIRRASLTEESDLFGSSESGFKKQMMMYVLLRFLERLTGKSLMRVYVCEAGRNVVGITVLIRDQDCWRINGVMVDPKYRGKGCGKKLISKTLEDATYFGVKRVCLEVLERNVVARSLYESLDFKKFERRLYFSADLSNAGESNLPQGLILRGGSETPFSRVVRKLIKLGITEKFAILRNRESIGVLELLIGYKKGMAGMSLALCDKYRGKGIEEVLLAKALGRARKFGMHKIVLNMDETNTELKEACGKFGFKFLCATQGMVKSLGER